MTRYEYKARKRLVDDTSSAVEDWLNLHGRQGYRLTAVVPESDESYAVLIMERSTPEALALREAHDQPDE